MLLMILAVYGFAVDGPLGSVIVGFLLITWTLKWYYRLTRFRNGLYMRDEQTGLNEDGGH